MQAVEAGQRAPLRTIGSWLRRHHGALLGLDDSSHAVALGAGIGAFVGFTPFFGVKTLLSILLAWLVRGNKLAAAIWVTLHDVTLPILPAILYWEYRIGIWMLGGSPDTGLDPAILPIRDFLHWSTLFALGKPLLLGSIVVGLPGGLLVYLFMRWSLIWAKRPRA